MLQYVTIVLAGVWKCIKTLRAEFLDKSCQKSAAALTYMTLFALVPLMTVTYSVFSVVPAFDGVADQLQSMIFNNFMPEAGKEVEGYLADFSSQARSLTGFGIAFLVVTAYLMLTNIEHTFNAIWGVKHPRRGLFSFLLYWAVLSIGPILLGTGLAISTYLLSMKLVVNELNQLGMLAPLVRGGQWVMTSAAFTLLFAAVPNCKVPLRFAVIGGAVTAVCFEVLKALFGYFVGGSSFQLIYGAFAIVPLFLLWVNLLWTIILGGAVLVRALAEWGYGNSSSNMSDMTIALACLNLFRERSRNGAFVTDSDCVALGIGIVHWQRIREILIENRWIAVTESGDYVLSRNLANVNLWHLSKLVGLSAEFNEKEFTSKEGWHQEYRHLQDEIDGFTQQKLGLSLESLLENSSHNKQS